MLVTALNTKIGYYKAAGKANTAHKKWHYLKRKAINLGIMLPLRIIDEWLKPEDYCRTLD